MVSFASSATDKSCVSLFLLLQAYGDGLQRAFENVPAQFIIDGIKPGLYAAAQLTVMVSSETADAIAKVTDEGDGRYSVTYTAKTVDEYKVSVRFENEHIALSPFTASVTKKTGAGKCVMRGDCLAHGARLIIGNPIEFDVVTSDAGEGPLSVTATGPNGESVPVFTSDKGDGVLAVRLDCQTTGHYTAEVRWAGDLVPGSPVHFMIVDRVSADQMKVS